MSIAENFKAELERFPPALKALVEAELAAGNEIMELASCFPAPPVGAYVKLARPVTTRRRASDDTLDFYERNSSLYSGEFTDSKRFFFVLEPPLRPPPEPDPDAIRASLSRSEPAPKEAEYRALEAGRSGSSTSAELAQSPVEAFRESMVINYDRRRDGIGYDLRQIGAASAEELAEIEDLLVSRPVEDWRDVEALAALNTPKAQAHLRQALKGGNPTISTAISRHAPFLMSEAERTALLVEALRTAAPFEDLSQTLDQVEDFHPPEVVDALWRGLLTCDGTTAVHFAAMLFYIYGRAEEAFDWSHRPFFLTFNTDDLDERRQRLNELCQKVDQDPATVLQEIRE